MPVLQDTLVSGLRGRIEGALAALNTQAVIGYIDYAVKARTARGEFLPGSSPSAGVYSTGHKRTREKGGYQTARVDLFMTGRMLDATKGVPEVFADQVRLQYGYIDGLSEIEATRLATYHQELGAGRSKVRRVFIGLTEDEKAKAVQILRDAFIAGL